jgi:hypothetical protein
MGGRIQNSKLEIQNVKVTTQPVMWRTACAASQAESLYPNQIFEF